MKIIWLTQGQFTLVDDEDYERVNHFKWYVNNAGGKLYARRTVNISSTSKSSMKLHRFILGVTNSEIQVDHIDGNSLNNQRLNLRTCTQAENKRNKTPYGTSKYLGVFYKKKRGKKWSANITKDGKKTFLGYFKDEKDAALSYDEAAKKLHGEFANLNFK